MIIQSARLAVGLDLAALERHVFYGQANEDVIVLHGDPDDLGVMQRDAAEAGKRYAIRRIKFSPDAAASRVQAADIMRDLGRKFGFRPGRCVVVEHLKPRGSAGGYERHWHVLAPEYDPVRRRVLDSHWMRPRQERIARLAELRLGHAPVTGRWNAAVARALTVAARLAEEPRPGNAYTANRHQAAARRGVKLPEAQALVMRAWTETDSGAALEAALATHGMHLRVGDKDGVWVIEINRGDDAAPVLVGALHRLVRQPRRLVAARMLATGLANGASKNSHAEPPAAAQGAGPVRQNKEHDHVEDHGYAYTKRHRRSSERKSDRRRSLEPASLGEKGLTPVQLACLRAALQTDRLLDLLDGEGTTEAPTQADRIEALLETIVGALEQQSARLCAIERALARRWA